MEESEDVASSVDTSARTDVLKCEILTVNDSKDPSFTNLTLPYRVICRQRYHKVAIKQRKQFIKAIKRVELLQINPLDGIRIHREFLDPVLSPARPEEIIRLTPAQKFKLEKLLNE